MRKLFFASGIWVVLLTTAGCGVSETRYAAFRDVNYFVNNSEEKYVIFKDVCFPRLRQSCTTLDVWVHPENVKVVPDNPMLSTTVSVFPRLTSMMFESHLIVWADQAIVHVPNIQVMEMWVKWVNNASARMDRDLENKRTPQTVIPRSPFN